VDGIVLYAMMVKYRPANVIEVVPELFRCMLDASEIHGLDTSFTLVEPEPHIAWIALLKARIMKNTALL
jgi:hypothetical protein